jgi:kumamolisin
MAEHRGDIAARSNADEYSNLGGRRSAAEDVQNWLDKAVPAEPVDALARFAASIWQRTEASKPAHDVSNGRTDIGSALSLKPKGVCKGECAPQTPLEVSVFVKSKASDGEIDREIQRIQQRVTGFMNDAEFEQRFGANPESVRELRKFAQANGLSVSQVDTRSGRVVLRGTASQFSTAFACKLQEYEQPDGTVVRARVGALTVPKELAGHVDAVLGLDDRAKARTHFIKLNDEETSAAFEPRSLFGYKPKAMLPTEVATLYKFPHATTGGGQNIALIELGGNPNPADYAKYYESHRMKIPQLNIITVDGAKVEPGKPHPANSELALDSEIIGAVAPDAVQNMIIAPNSERGFVDAIERAAFPREGEAPNQAISISWGLNEKAWSAQGLLEMNNMFKKAWIRGIGVYAASGDDGAKDGTDTYQPDYPASDPYVTATGGTRLIGRNGEIAAETVWNNGKWSGSTGGGVSEIWNVPDYQRDVSVPPSANNTGKPGRGVPDISGNADPRSGYIIRVDGKESTIGGTSGVAPLYAALHARLAQAVGSSAPTQLGNLNPFFYRHGLQGGFFNDITDGDNNGYKAGRGWDAASGWGSVRDGNRMLAMLKADIASQRQTLAMFPQLRKVAYGLFPMSPMKVPA